jgi:hypothetical protein
MAEIFLKAYGDAPSPLRRSGLTKPAVLAKPGRWHHGRGLPIEFRSPANPRKLARLLGCASGFESR